MQQKEKKFEPIKMPIKAKGLADAQVQKQITTDKHPQKKIQKQQQIPQSEERIEFQGKVNKESIAAEILQNGYVQSYADFFYVTNETVPKLFYQPSGISLEEHFSNHRIHQKYINQDEEFLLDLKKRLQSAEENAKYEKPDKTQALNEYLNLAEFFFTEYQDYIVAAYFYKRVIQISRQYTEAKAEGKGKLGYAKCHYQVGLIDQAIQILEESMKQCEQLQNLDSVVEQMSTELIKIYNRMAQEYEKGDNDQIAQSLKYYDKCREAAQKAGDLESEGVICNKIGGLYFKMQNIQKSIQYHHKFLEIVKQLHKEDSKQKEMEAHSSLAQCYLKKGDVDEAQKHLESYYALAKDQKLYNSQSDAALHLAKLYQSKGNTAKSLEYFQQHFDCAKSEKPEQKSRKLIDRARVTYGIAKANAFMDNYIKLVANSDKNLKALLDWKSKRDK
ncbi:unnamed protein product [Paramecium sonneborni]|uniref:Tetratricopeptide repeat protein n=1 Tax=Paramecium sonneborni TaxID=65129 RepID=A0A8S1NL50_9CILI|nr:unnamed protein product [Paramecium sonneborni]